ncbi:hypothetical protein BV898_00926 [Hypsibius exemplaris]|uniref:Uncharacterized protein n=1 Tax=Hypsibius exemplaris TaxID=2072580 RepID=A0A1W0XCQ8_HYPEX|nr:hypothetical protein BV898_00926 [Hypsibius exemplaris]
MELPRNEADGGDKENAPIASRTRRPSRIFRLHSNLNEIKLARPGVDVGKKQPKTFLKPTPLIKRKIEQPKKANGAANQKRKIQDVFADGGIKLKTLCPLFVETVAPVNSRVPLQLDKTGQVDDVALPELRDTAHVAPIVTQPAIVAPVAIPVPDQAVAGLPDSFTFEEKDTDLEVALPHPPTPVNALPITVEPRRPAIQEIFVPIDRRPSRDGFSFVGVVLAVLAAVAVLFILCQLSEGWRLGSQDGRHKYLPVNASIRAGSLPG